MPPDQNPEKVAAEAAKKTQDSLDKLNTSLEGLATLPKVMSGMMEGLVAIGKKIDGIPGKGDKVTKTKEPEKKSKEQIDDMAPTDLVAHIVTAVQDTLIKPLSEKIEGLRTSISTTSTKGDVEKARDSHPDFIEWRDEITTLAKSKPGLSVEELYILARSSNTDKATEIDKKAADVKKKEDDEKVKEEPAFGGLLPTSGVHAEGDKNMSQKEAGDAAWNTVMANVPSEVFSDNS